MFPLDRMLSVDLLIRDKKIYKTANIFGLIAYSERNPFVVKVMRDSDFWNSLNTRTDGWILYAVKPESDYYAGGNADYINQCLGLKPEDYPQLIILGIGTDRIMKQRNYPIAGDSVESVYKSIEKNIDLVSASVKKIYPDYKTSTNVFREVVASLDAELASVKWKRVASGLKEMVLSLVKCL